MNLRFARYLVALSLLAIPVAMAKQTTHPKHHTAKKDVVNISVTGVENKDILKNIQSSLKNIKSVHLTKPVNQDSVYSIYSSAPEGIKKAIQPYGYFNPQISPSFKKTHGTWYLHFAVKPGIRSIVTRVHINITGQGAHNAAFMRVVKHYPLKQGKFFSLPKYNDGNNLLFEHAANLGFFKAKMEKNKITVNLNNNTVQVDIVFDTGIRHRFGTTHFTKTPLNVKFLRKFMDYKEGEYYDNAKVQQTQNNFSDSNYFSQIVVSPEVKNTINYVTPMKILLHMRKRKVYTFGLGYSTDTQIRGTLGFKYRWVNSWGHYFDSRFQGSFVNYSLVAGYHIPWPNPMKDLFSFKVGAGKLNIKRGNSTSAKVSILYKHSYTRWAHTISINYLNERYDMTNLPKTQARLFYPEANVSYYSTRNHINPDIGVRFTADLSGTPSALSTKSGFWQAKLESKAIVTFLKHEQIAARLAYGRTEISSINNLPLSLQFLIGGSQTVRGYSYQSIGPGRNMIYGSFEFRQRIWKELYLAGFYDFGNVTDERLFSNIRDSVGPAILYRSPIGVIELSVAWRLAAHKKIRPRIVFSMGPEL
jgi:translocation and assembly module TamA